MTNVKEQSPALKRRQTKLLKKSKEELIEVILRKDKVEKNQVKQISNLKGEINSLQTKIKSLIADNNGTIKTLEDIKKNLSILDDRNKALVEMLDCKDTELTDITNNFTRYKLENAGKLKILNNIAITFIVLSIIMTILYIIK